MHLELVLFAVKYPLKALETTRQNTKGRISGTSCTLVILRYARAQSEWVFPVAYVELRMTKLEVVRKGF